MKRFLQYPVFLILLLMLIFCFIWAASGRLLGYVAFLANVVTLYWLALKIRHSRISAMTKKSSPPTYEAVATKLTEIEAEMKRIGLWQQQPLAPEQYEFTRAFGGDTMSFDQWLQFILIPRVKSIIEAKGEFPGSSSVAAQAIREFDGRNDTSDLHMRLYEFDRLF